MLGSRLADLEAENAMYSLTLLTRHCCGRRGLTPDQRFMLGSRLADLEDSCKPTATAFPGGSMFTSTGTSRAVQTGVKGAPAQPQLR